MMVHAKNDLRDPETEFLCGLLELQYGLPVMEKLKHWSQIISWARGWPEDDVAFWNAEAFLWSHKIEKSVRRGITEELSLLSGGKNLDIGCGAYSYIPSVGFDMAEKMLQYNERCAEKVLGSLEEKLPFLDASFDSVTAVFVLNYVLRCKELLLEIRRVLSLKGCFVAVFSGKGVKEWQKQKEVRQKSFLEWRKVFEDAGFIVTAYEKEELWFFRCLK